MKRDGEEGMAVLACSCVASVAASEHMHMALRRSSGVRLGMEGAFQPGQAREVFRGIKGGRSNDVCPESLVRLSPPRT